MKKLSTKTRLLISLPLLVAIGVFFWFSFAPSFIINSSLTRQRDILENNEQFVLYSLDPGSVWSTSDADGNPILGKVYKEKFHKYGVLGKTQITDKNTKLQLVKTLYSGLDGGNPLGIMCFDPRHGVRVMRGGQTVDLLICFECEQIHVYTASADRRVHFSNASQKLFDAVLKNAKVPLAKRPNY